MSGFSEYLQHLIQSRNISIARLSRESGVERTAIHKALTGGRILSYHALEALACHLQLSPAEMHRLRQCYEQLFESEASRKAKEIIRQMLLRLSEIPLYREENMWKPDMTQAGYPECKVYKGYAGISYVLQRLLDEELRTEHPCLEIAVPCGVKGVEDCLAHVLSAENPVEVSHIVCFEVSGAAEEYSLGNLEAFGRLLPSCVLKRQKYHIYYYYSEMGKYAYTDPLPYYLVCHAGVLCFSRNCQTAMLIKDAEQIEYFHMCFYELKLSCQELTEYVNGRERVARIWQAAAKEEEVCLITSEADQIRMGWETVLLDRRGVTGRLGAGRGDPAIQSFARAVSDGSVRGRILKDMELPFVENMSLLVSMQEGILLCGREQTWGVCVREGSLCRALYDWCGYFSESEHVFDRENTIEILKEDTYYYENQTGHA